MFNISLHGWKQWKPDSLRWRRLFARKWIRYTGSTCETARSEMHQSEQLKKTANHSRASCFIRSRMTSRPHRLKKTSSMQSKRRDLHHTWLHRETNGKISFYCYSPRWTKAAFFTKLSIYSLPKSYGNFKMRFTCATYTDLSFLITDEIPRVWLN